MSSSKRFKPANLKLWIIPSLIVLCNAGLAASLWPYAVQAAHHRADQFVEAGKRTSGSEAELDFKLAQKLDPGNQLAAAVVAQRLLEEHQAAKALAVLNRATRKATGETAAIAELYVQALLETGNTIGAVTEANMLASQTQSADQLRLAGLAYGVGERPDLFALLKGRLDLSEASQRVIAAQSDKLVLAQELYARGLLDASQRLLTKQSDSISRDLLLGLLWSRSGTMSDLDQARDAYLAATKLDPANRAAREGLIRTLQALGDRDGAAKQAGLLHRLEVGQP